jgi:transcriptional regulator with XRE-family HTH domain
MDTREQDGNLGSVLRKERSERGVSQSSLAVRTGVPQSAISRIESGREVPSLDRWRRLLAGLGLKPEIELVMIAEPPSEPEHTFYNRRLDPGVLLEQAAGWNTAVEKMRGKATKAA